MIASILQYRFTNQQFLIFLVSITILVRLGFVLFGDAPLIGDMKSMYESAKQVALGNRIGAVAQLPFILYQSLLIRIFGDTIFVLQLCNILFCTGTAFFIYRIASIVFQEECGRIAAVVYALYIPNILTSALLTAEPLATCLFYFACYILLHKGLSHSYMWIFSAILLAFSNMIHPVGIFFNDRCVRICHVNRSVSGITKTKCTTKNDRSNCYVLCDALWDKLLDANDRNASIHNL